MHKKTNTLLAYLSHKMPTDLPAIRQKLNTYVSYLQHLSLRELSIDDEFLPKNIDVLVSPALLSAHGYNAKIIMNNLLQIEALFFRKMGIGSFLTYCGFQSPLKLLPQATQSYEGDMCEIWAFTPMYFTWHIEKFYVVDSLSINDNPMDKIALPTQKAGKYQINLGFSAWNFETPIHTQNTHTMSYTYEVQSKK